jgi:micrococcal nuclease
MKKYLLSAVFSIGILCNANAYKAKVVKIQDGDTIYVIYKGKKQRIRFKCLDTPEPSQVFNGINVGKEATKYLESVIKVNDIVEIDFTGDISYDRLISYVYKRGVNLSHLSLQNGNGYADRRYCSQEELKMEQEAKIKKIGLWQYGEYEYPPIYRLRRDLEKLQHENNISR